MFGLFIMILFVTLIVLSFLTQLTGSLVEQWSLAFFQQSGHLIE